MTKPSQEDERPFKEGQLVSWENQVGTIVRGPAGRHRVYEVLSRTGHVHDVPQVLLEKCNH